MFTKKQCPQIVCIVWTLLFFALPAKTTNIDSLYTVLSQSKIDSEERLGTLTAISYAYFVQRMFDSVLVYGRDGYDLAKKLNDQEAMYQTANDLMVANMEKNRLEENTEYIQDFEKLYRQQKINPDKYSRILYLESFTCYMLEDVDALQKSVEKLKEVQPKVSEKKLTKTLGYTYYFGAQFFKLEEDFVAADSLFRQKLELNHSSADTNGMAATYFDLALLHTESTKDYDKALEYLKTGLEITEAAGETYMAERLLGLQFYARVKNGYNELAAMQLDTMNTLAEKAGSKSPSIFSARIYLSMGEFFYNEGAYDQAEEFFAKSEQQLSGEVNDPMIQLVYKAHSENYLALGEPRMAYNYLQKALELKDSIHQAELKNIIDYNRTQISLKDQANENLRLSNVIRKRNLGIAFVIFCGLVLLYIVWEKVKTNRKLEKLNNQIASDAEKLAEANEHLEFFSRSIYHDINSRINLILSFSELKKKNAFPEPNENEVDEFTMLIYKNALFLKQFVQDIRTFSKLEQNSTPMKEIDLNSVVGLVLETFGGQIYEKKAILNIPELPVITGHETPVVQLFQNLTENAIKYTREDAEPLINIDFKEEEDKYKFSIENNGSPIPQDVADRIFEPFYRIKKKNVNGSGLGLAICKRIVDYYGGRLWLEKSDEISTVFAFTLPKEFKKNIA